MIKKILVVDDDPIQLRLVEKILSENNYKVQVSGEAPEGLQMVMNTEPDLIILDVMMPIINGYNFCKLIKDNDEKSRIPIILVTERSDQEDIQIGLDAGAEAYLCKPIQIEELLRTIRMVDGNLTKGIV